MELNLDIKFDGDVCKVNGVSCSVDGQTGISCLASVLGEYCRTVGAQLNGLYNKAIFWPDELRFVMDWTLRARYSLQPTQHAYDRMREYHLPMGCYSAVLYGEVVEAEVEHGKVVKVVTRLPNKWRDGEDLCAAVAFSHDDYGTRVATVITVWPNDTRDMTPVNLKNYVTGKEKAE